MNIDIQPPGEPVPERTVSFPPPKPITGKYTTLQPLTLSHSPSLFIHLGGAANASIWTYLPTPPLADQSSCDALITQFCAKTDPQYYAVMSAGSDESLGFMSLLNIVPEHRRLEIGWVTFGKALQRTTMATEAFYLLMKRAFDEFGYQRVEWKANALNKASLAAAERLGFVPEGVFRKHLIVKDKWRDTAWFSVTDDEWPFLKKRFEAWLDPSNFDSDGRQKRGLKECRQP